MQTLEDAFEQVTTGPAAGFRNLLLTPLVTQQTSHIDYLTLDEGLASGRVRVTETSDAGHVPELKLENSSDKAVLLIDGEELVGAKQNRVLNLTILAPPKRTIVIPVSCVEAGRWNALSHEFSTRGRAFYATGRARKAEQVSASLRASGVARSRQGEVWADIAAKSSRMSSYSETAAMASMYEDHDDQLNAYVQAMRPLKGQVGAIFAINGAIRGIELFDHPLTFRRLMSKLMRSYALDAIDEHTVSFSPLTPDPQGFLAEVAAASISAHSAVGEGIDLRISAARLAGGALVARDRVVHLYAFRQADADWDDPGADSNAAHHQRRRHRY